MRTHTATSSRRNINGEFSDHDFAHAHLHFVAHLSSYYNALPSPRVLYIDGPSVGMLSLALQFVRVTSLITFGSASPGRPAHGCRLRLKICTLAVGGAEPSKTRLRDGSRVFDYGHTVVVEVEGSAMLACRRGHLITRWRAHQRVPRQVSGLEELLEVARVEMAAGSNHSQRARRRWVC